MVYEQGTEISITLPETLLNEVQRIADEEEWTLDQAAAFLVQRGLQLQSASEENLQRSYERLVNEEDGSKKPEARQELIKAIFGPSAIAKD